MKNLEKNSMDYESECARLKECLNYKEKEFKNETERYLSIIAELEHQLMIYEQKWSVIDLIFGK